MVLSSHPVGPIIELRSSGSGAGKHLHLLSQLAAQTVSFMASVLQFSGPIQFYTEHPSTSFCLCNLNGTSTPTSHELTSFRERLSTWVPSDDSRGSGSVFVVGLDVVVTCALSFLSGGTWCL